MEPVQPVKAQELAEVSEREGDAVASQTVLAWDWAANVFARPATQKLNTNAVFLATKPSVQNATLAWPEPGKTAHKMSVALAGIFW